MTVRRRLPLFASVVMALRMSGGGLLAQDAAPISCGPYLQDAGQTRMTVMWTSDTAAEGVVRCGPGLATGPAINVPPRKLEYPKDPENFRPDTKDLPPAEVAAAFVYKATLTNLSPGTVYAYSVVFAGQKAEGSFRTFPAQVEPFTFIVFSDTHTRDAVSASFPQHKPAFLMNTGDLVDNEHYGQYRAFFSPALSAAAGQAPLFVCRGNHDGSGRVMSRLFAFPGGRLSYSFDYANAHFVVLDSVVWRSADKEERIKAMLDWCERDLAASQATWKIVFFHEPPYDHTRTRAEAQVRAYLPILRRGGVDLVQNGHCHAYQRFRPLYWPGENAERPITFVVSAGGWKGGRDIATATPYLAAARYGSHYIAYRIEGETLTARVLTPKGDVLDTFTLSKKHGRPDPQYVAQALPEDLLARLDRGLDRVALPKASFTAGETFSLELKLHAASQPLHIELAPSADSARAVEQVGTATADIPAHGSSTIRIQLRARVDLAEQKDGSTAPNIVLDCRYRAPGIEGVIATTAASSK